MLLTLSFQFRDRLVWIEDVRAITVQPYVFNGQMAAEAALVADGTAFELRYVSDIRLSVHRASGEN